MKVDVQSRLFDLRMRDTMQDVKQSGRNMIAATENKIWPPLLWRLSEILIIDLFLLLDD